MIVVSTIAFVAIGAHTRRVEVNGFLKSAYAGYCRALRLANVCDQSNFADRIAFLYWGVHLDWVGMRATKQSLHLVLP